MMTSDKASMVRACCASKNFRTYGAAGFWRTCAGAAPDSIGKPSVAAADPAITFSVCRRVVEREPESDVSSTFIGFRALWNLRPLQYTPKDQAQHPICA